MASALKKVIVNIFVAVPINRACNRYLSSRLAKVGILETPKDHGKSYETGQLFLHKIFGYRGVILFPWLARVYDRDTATKTEEKSVDEQTTSIGKEVKGKNHLHYQVLMDSRDSPHIRAQTEAVTFLGNPSDTRSLYTIPGLDYVAHEDILPYLSVERSPIEHELFDQFLIYDPESSPSFTSSETLRAWQNKNQPWLQLSDVHRETTENIRVTVIPFFMGCRESQQVNDYWWRYCVRLQNFGEERVQIRERHWRIFSISGTLETVRGVGVGGHVQVQEPILSTEQPAFQYSSHIALQAPSGHMWGTFKMERQDGTVFDCKIPQFSLESKSEEANNPNSFLGS
ncbi:polymerase delta-interacting protein 2 [Patella vulgata]|uniref:polymerase delta-interacting protein 2 n=1 Tax=Patella vulgata TaxID=6465 RepID=UPI0021803529|nr:polymerase delta-interacting protein 2 [Patella vulgata]